MFNSDILGIVELSNTKWLYFAKAWSINQIACIKYIIRITKTWWKI